MRKLVLVTVVLVVLLALGDIEAEAVGGRLCPGDLKIWPTRGVASDYLGLTVVAEADPVSPLNVGLAMFLVLPGTQYVKELVPLTDRYGPGRPEMVRELIDPSDFPDARWLFGARLVIVVVGTWGGCGYYTLHAWLEG